MSASPTRSAVLSNPGSAELRAAVDLHMALLPHGFFVELGPAFMNHYYGHFVNSPHAYARVATIEGRVVGALVGTLNHAAHAHWTNDDLPRFAARGALSLLQRPKLLPRFVRDRLVRYTKATTRRLLRSPGHASAGGPTQQVAVLSHVCVDRDRQGKGLGKKLINDFLRSAREAGAARVELVTLDGPDGAGNFYGASGWRRRGSPHMVDGRPFQTYVRDL